MHATHRLYLVEDLESFYAASELVRLVFAVCVRPRMRRQAGEFEHDTPVKRNSIFFMFNIPPKPYDPSFAPTLR